MIPPALELQALIVSTLRADATTSGLVAGVYDLPPADNGSNTVWGDKNAYISLGATDILIDDADGIAGETHTIQIDVWSRKLGQVHCKQICAAVKKALHDVEFDLGQNALVEILLDVYHVLRDPDGLTTHGAMQFTAMVEEYD